MGWLDVLNTGLGVANLAINVNNAVNIDTLKKQGLSAADVALFLSQARNEVFKIKQSADQIESTYPTNQPKLAAGAFAILDDQLTLSGLIPDLFPDFNDKEYVASTIKYIKDKKNEHFAELSESDKQEVIELLNRMHSIPKINYYIDNLKVYRKYRIALKDSKSGGGIEKNKLGKNIMGVGFLSLCIVPLILVTMFGNNSPIGYICSGIVFFGLVGYGAYLFFPSLDSADAEKAVANLSAKIDVSQMEPLDNQFGGAEKAKDALDENNNFIKSFFATSSFLEN